MRKNLLCFSLLLWLISTHCFAQNVISIADARTKDEGTLVTVKGVVTTEDNVTNTSLRYLQDETGAIAIYQGTDTYGYNIMESERGDTLLITGKVDIFFDVLQVSLSEAATEGKAELIYDRSEAADPTALPRPKVVTASILADSLEGQLLSFVDAKFIPQGAVFNGRTTYTLVDSTDNEVREFKFRVVTSNHPLVGKPIPTGLVEVIGVLDQFRGEYQILPRDENDVIAGLAIENFAQQAVSPRSVQLGFTTTLPTDGFIRYKRYDQPDSEYDTLALAGNRSNYNLNIPGLEPAQFYMVELYTAATSDPNKTAALINQMVATRSESSGTIDVYFNYLPEDLPADFAYDPANYTTDFATEIASLINDAVFSVDVAIYNVNFGGNAILDALNRAAARGVQVRYLYQADGSNHEIGYLSGRVAQQSRASTDDGIMHNKFVVIDPTSTQNSYVITGSANWTDNNLNDDPNDLLVIQDQAIARAFMVEFNEMWGGSGTQTSADNLKFGAAKTNNIPHLYQVGGRPVELYFSPTDAVDTRIARALRDTRSDIRFALADITRNNLADALVAEAEAGWSVKGIVEIAGSYFPALDSIDDNSEDILLDLIDSPVNVVLDSVTNLHHKFVVVNALRPNTNPFVLTGSHNWSTSAELRNDENTLVIYDADIAEAYLNHWRILYYAASGGQRDNVLTSTPADPNQQLKVYPVPSRGYLTLNNTTGQALGVRVVSSTGALAYTSQLAANQNEEELNLSHLPAGIYVLQLQTATFSTTKRIVITR